MSTPEGVEYFYILTLRDTASTGQTRISMSDGLWFADPGATRSDAYEEIRSYVIRKNRLSEEAVTTFVSLEKNTL